MSGSPRKWAALAAATALASSALIALTTGAANASIGCLVEPAGNEPVAAHASADGASAVVGSVTLAKPGRGCTGTPGAAYTECGGGTVWYRTSVSGTTGYVPASCASLTYW